MLRRLVPLALACVAPALGAQSPFDIGARIAPQFHSYRISSPTNTTISEFAIPLFVTIPVAPRLSFDVGTSYASARVEQTGTRKTTSDISGLTDTQIRANLTLGNDFIILTGGVNLPTGQAQVLDDQLPAASLIGSDFLSFPISNMGTGFGGTGGVAMARPVGDWNFGLGFSMRQSAEYEPFKLTTGSAMRYQPGNEYRGRIGLERPVGTGHFMVGLTYSKFGDDDLEGSVYNTGDRYLSQLDFNNDVAGGRLSISGWNLFRMKGTLVDGSTLDRENITNAALSYGVPLGSSAVLEPNVEGRSWLQGGGASTSFMGTLGVRLALSVGGFSILPGGGFSFGQIAAAEASGVNTTASLTGFHGTLAIRLR
ncbi:MAG TPA: hypothetical protein VIP11_11575 [Gemmatimonadaceae bacterium]